MDDIMRPIYWLGLNGSWKFIIYMSLVMDAGIFLFSFVSLLATFC
jgi:hypothetical protein